MIKKYIYLVMMLLAGSVAIAQKEYNFDYVLEYKYTGKDQKIYNEYRFFNSKDNSFIFSVWEDKNELIMMLYLESGKYYRSSMPKEDFFVVAISMKCPSTGYKKNYEKLKEFKFEKLTDTIINAERLSHFVVSPLNKKEIEEYELMPVHYITDNKYNFDFPVLKPSELLYRMWEKDIAIPNGIIKNMYSVGAGQYKTYMELVQCIPTTKLIIVDSNCK